MPVGPSRCNSKPLPPRPFPVKRRSCSTQQHPERPSYDVRFIPPSSLLVRMDLPPVSSPDPPPPPTFIVDDADAPFRSSQRLAVSPARDSGRPLASSASSPFLALPGMSDDAEPVGSTGDGVPNPFNFQTQVISTSPVKSVSLGAQPLSFAVPYRLLQFANAKALLEHRSAPWPQIQA